MSTPDGTDPAPAGRPRRRRNVIGGSPHRDEYIGMMRAGWTSVSIERYAAHRYGETIPAATVRSYKSRKGIESQTVSRFGTHSPDELVDVVAVRRQLIELQTERIRIDWAHEQSMNKLFGANRAEIALLNDLLDDHRADLQALGLFPIAGQEITVRTGVAAEAPELPKHRSLADAIGNEGMTAEMAMQAARFVHRALPPAATDE